MLSINCLVEEGVMCLLGGEGGGGFLLGVHVAISYIKLMVY